MGSSTADINRLQGTVNQLQQELDGATSELSTASTLQVHTPQTTVFHPVLGWFHWPNDLCPTCNKEVEHRGVQCDICAAWYHYHYQNLKDSGHIYVLSSYNVSLMMQGKHTWMHKKVKMSQVNWVFMPVNVNGNHWVLLAANVPAMTVNVLDSMNCRRNKPIIQKFKNYMQARSAVTGDLPGDWKEVAAVAWFYQPVPFKRFSKS